MLDEELGRRTVGESADPEVEILLAASLEVHEVRARMSEAEFGDLLGDVALLQLRILLRVWHK